MSTKNLSDLLEHDIGPLTFGKFLRSARLLKNLSQTQMAKLLKISRSSLCDIEKERQFVSPSLAARIAKKCGLSEVVAVETALMDQIRRAKLSFNIEVRSVKKQAA